jgi:DNA-directed RNA polymerase specialized sigma24 family protein
MSYRDIADTLGISVATAKSQVSRAGPRLKSALAEHYPELESHLDKPGR